MIKILACVVIAMNCIAFQQKEMFSDVYKPLSTAYLNDLFDSAPPESQEELNQMFRVKKVINPHNRKRKKIVSYCLFWKAPHLGMPMPRVNEETIHKTFTFSRASTSFYQYYVVPMMSAIKTRATVYKDRISRIYLASDLEFLAEHLAQETDAEIYLMASNSLAHSPGAMWRFLAFDDPQADFVVMDDSDDGFFDLHEALQTQWLNDASTDGWFRFTNLDPSGNLRDALYSPIMVAHFGCKNIKAMKINVEKAMKGFILHRGLYLEEERHPRDIAYPQHPYGFGNEFPSYGFDERFLKHVIYFEAAYREN